MAKPQPITTKVAGARIVARNLRHLGFHRLISISGQGFVLHVLDRLELDDRHPTEAELAEISAIRAAACFTSKASA
jgi:hypothetical protein